MLMKVFKSGLILFFLSYSGFSYAHGGGLDKSALAACDTKKKSQECKYEGHHNDLYIGTCQYASEDLLICVRNKPIQHSYSKEEHSDKTAY